MPPKKTIAKKKYTKRSYGKKKSTSYGTKNLVKLIKNVTMRETETKDRDVSIGKVELYHNTYTNLGNPFALSYPTQGTGDSDRIGDSIQQRGIKFRMLLGQKKDRPNVTFKIWLLQVPKGQPFTPSQLFDITTGNVMLDSTNPDRVKVVYSRVLRKVIANQGAPNVDAYKECTYPFQFYLKRPKKITFSADNSIDPGQSDRDYFLIAAPYDAYGSLITDNIAYIQTFCRYYYKDP